MLDNKTINKMCVDFLMSFVDDSVRYKYEPIQVNLEDKNITMLCLGTDMSDEDLENYMNLVLEL